MKTKRDSPPRKTPLAAGGGKAPARRFPWVRLLLIALLLALLLPVGEVALARIAHPPLTPLMALRWVGDRFSKDGKPRVLYQWQDWRALPPTFLKAAWTAEDQRFFKHHGFDWAEMSHALDKAERTGQEPRGSSTITMQCARSLFLWQGHSYIRKALEAYYTVLMEAMLSKRRILELYANVIEMGPGVYGVQAASRYHYGIDDARLTAEQAATLAALLPAPRTWNPRAPSKRMLARKERILRDLPALRWPEG